MLAKLLQKGYFQPSGSLSHRDGTASSPSLNQAEGRKRGIGGIFLGTAPWLEGSFMSGSTLPRFHPVFVQSLSLPLLALLSPIPWPLSLSPTSLPGSGPEGVAGLSGQTDPPGMARLVVSIWKETGGKW